MFLYRALYKIPSQSSLTEMITVRYIRMLQTGYMPVKQAVHKESSPIIDLKSSIDK